MHDWVVWRKSKKMAEEISSFELSGEANLIVFNSGENKRTIGRPKVN